MSQILEAIPYARYIGVSIEQGDDGMECVLPFRDLIIGNPRLPAVHGGVIGAFLELTALLRLIAESGTDRVPKPIDARPGRDLQARPSHRQRPRGGLAGRSQQAGGVRHRQVSRRGSAVGGRVHRRERRGTQDAPLCPSATPVVKSRV
jgi:hypothetical protein